MCNEKCETCLGFQAKHIGRGERNTSNCNFHHHETPISDIELQNNIKKHQIKIEEEKQEYTNYLQKRNQGIIDFYNKLITQDQLQEIIGSNPRKSSIQRTIMDDICDSVRHHN